MKNACEGVLYPVNAASQIQLKDQPCAPKTFPILGSNLNAIEVSHKAWLYCKEELENIFSYLKKHNEKTSRLFVLAPLHKGPITFDDKFKVYCPEKGILKGSDWQINLDTPQEIKALNFVEANDDVCTEEHSLEIISPFIYKTYPKAMVCYLLAPDKKEEICEITSIIGRLYQNSIIFLSNNEQTNCAHMWMGSL
jgi:AmmeMemoRadiSam system protein B